MKTDLIVQKERDPLLPDRAPHRYTVEVCGCHTEDSQVVLRCRNHSVETRTDSPWFWQ